VPSHETQDTSRQSLVWATPVDPFCGEGNINTASHPEPKLKPQTYNPAFNQRQQQDKQEQLLNNHAAVFQAKGGRAGYCNACLRRFHLEIRLYIYKRLTG